MTSRLMVSDGECGCVAEELKRRENVGSLVDPREPLEVVILFTLSVLGFTVPLILLTCQHRSNPIKKISRSTITHSLE
jgi:hypothetical protein